VLKLSQKNLVVSTLDAANPNSSEVE
jgi:hypothetical protein